MAEVTTPGIRLPADMRRTLDALAAAEGRSLGNLIRLLIRDGLERRGLYPVGAPAPASTQQEVRQ